MRLITLFAALALLLAPCAAIANPVGKYVVEGINPGSETKYKGYVSVEKTGDSYRVIWDIGGKVYVGTGLGDAKFLAVSYIVGSESGIAFYSAAGGDWVGLWTYAGGRQLGSERWQREAAETPPPSTPPPSGPPPGSLSAPPGSGN